MQISLMPLLLITTAMLTAKNAGLDDHPEYRSPRSHLSELETFFLLSITNVHGRLPELKAIDRLRSDG